MEGLRDLINRHYQLCCSLNREDFGEINKLERSIEIEMENINKRLRDCKQRAMLKVMEKEIGISYINENYKDNK